MSASQFLRPTIYRRSLPRCPVSATSFRQHNGTIRGLSEVQALRADQVELETFRATAFKPELPLLLKSPNEESSLPAAKRWFHHGDTSTSEAESVIVTKYLYAFRGAQVPYELIGRAEDDNLQKFISILKGREIEPRRMMGKILAHHLAEKPASPEPQLYRFHAPLGLFFSALSFNAMGHTPPLTQLYIAQASLADLPPALREDLPAPKYVTSAGRGDIYDSSIWLGLEPTYTPFHRDPNPNLFHQLCSSKVIRLLPPREGELIFRNVQMHLGVTGSARIRGNEMFDGPERAALHEAVWGADAPEGMREARLRPGDSLFIPKGWWHSVKSLSSEGGLNGSVNWWFR